MFEKDNIYRFHTFQGGEGMVSLNKSVKFCWKWWTQSLKDLRLWIWTGLIDLKVGGGWWWVGGPSNFIVNQSPNPWILGFEILDLDFGLDKMCLIWPFNVAVHQYLNCEGWSETPLLMLLMFQHCCPWWLEFLLWVWWFYLLPLPLLQR